MTTEAEKSSNLLKLATKLNESNYSLWFFQMEILLQQEKLLELEEECTVWAIENQLPAIVESPKARMCIVINCNETIMTSLMLMKSAKEMWEHLFKTYSGENYSRKLEGIRGLASLRFTGGSVTDFMDKIFLKLNATIIAAGKDEISLTELTLALMLNSLPNRFATVRAQLEQDVKNLTIINVRAKLKEEEQRQTLRSEGFVGNVVRPYSTGERVHNGPTCQHNRLKAKCWTCTPSSHPSNAKCKDCNKSGHRSSMSARCSMNSAQAQSQSGENSTANAVINSSSVIKEAEIEEVCLPKPSFFNRTNLVILGEKDLRRRLQSSIYTNRVNSVVKANKVDHVTKRHKAEPSKDAYVLDSGCSQSILFNKEKLSNYLPFTTTMTTADNGALKCIGKGDLVLNHAITIRNVLHCPDVTLNLISTSQLCDMGLTLEMNERRIIVKQKAEVLLVVPRMDNLYAYVIPQSRALLLKGSSRTELSHRRLGHLYYKSLKLLSHLIEGLKYGCF